MNLATAAKMDAKVPAIDEFTGAQSRKIDTAVPKFKTKNTVTAQMNSRDTVMPRTT